MDGGVRSGQDVFKAVALGAKGVVRMLLLLLLLLLLLMPSSPSHPLFVCPPHSR
jgi:hypothetical protein